MFHFSSSSCSRRSSPKGAMRRKRRSSSSLVLALLLWMTLSMLGRPACGQWQGYSDVSCDAPLGIDEAMLLLRGFRGTYAMRWYWCLCVCLCGGLRRDSM